VEVAECIEYMATLPDACVDAVISDLPYGTTACGWDTMIPFPALWSAWKRVLKPCGAVVLFGSEPFSSLLRTSNLACYKFDWIWDKCRGVGMSTVKHRPMKQHETISVFAWGKPTYNPQMTPREKPLDSSAWKFETVHPENGNFNIRGRKPGRIYTERFPTSLIRVHKDANECNGQTRIHPTQKPVELMRYLVRTHTNPGDVVLDQCCGSGSTLVAARIEGRRFIGCDSEEKYVAMARKRLASELPWAAGEGRG
jgi:site-specific DNA-methyltransferase (adenine-specific)